MDMLIDIVQNMYARLFYLHGKRLSAFEPHKTAFILKKAFIFRKDLLESHYSRFAKFIALWLK